MKIEINPISPIKLGGVAEVNSVKNEKVSAMNESFSELLSKAIGQVNTLQKQGDEARMLLATGNVEDLHTVMIATEKASLAMQLTVQIRNKAVEAYQEIMRMQI